MNYNRYAKSIKNKSKKQLLEMRVSLAGRINESNLNTASIIEKLKIVNSLLQGKEITIDDDNVNSPRRLYETVVNGGSDDLKSLFADDVTAIGLINDMEALVHDKLNYVVSTVNAFFDTNKMLDRKDYAILGQKELEKPLFGLAMQLYTGNEPDYKQFMIKQYKLFGIKDDE